MLSENTFNNKGLHNIHLRFSYPRRLLIGLLLIVALVAFEIFNFDTTRFALHSLLGEANFLGLHWAVVLAIAFCAIDFAGLARLFTPEQGADEPRAVWYLMGAWLLGATMNAIMTWWAVNLTLLDRNLGNEVLSRQEILRFVPLFVAVLVWLTRILFIGALSIAGEHLFETSGRAVANSRRPVQQKRKAPVAAKPKPKNRKLPGSRPQSRINKRPPSPGITRPVPIGMQAKGRGH